MSFPMAMALSCNSFWAVETSPALLARRLPMPRPEQIDAHHLRDAARVVPIALVDTFNSRQISPASSLMHKAVSLTET
jgi:hypothetical protein